MTGQVDDLRKRNQSAVRLLHELAAADEVKLREGSLSICVFCSRGSCQRKVEGYVHSAYLLQIDYSRFLTKRIVLKFGVEVSTLFVEVHCVKIWGGGVNPFSL